MIKSSLIVSTLLLVVTSFAYAQGNQDSTGVKRGKYFLIRPQDKNRSGARTASSLKETLGMKPEEELRKISDKADKHGFVNQRYQQFSKGIPVEYGKVSVSLKQGSINSISGELYAIPPSLSNNASISEAMALTTAKNYVNARKYREENPNAELVYVKVSIPAGGKQQNVMALAYKFIIDAREPLLRDEIYVDAHTNAVIHRNPLIKHAVQGEAATRYSGTQTISTTFDAALGKYVLKDDSRGARIETYNLNNGDDLNGVTDFTDDNNQWTTAESSTLHKDNAALDAHWGATATYDYFFNHHGRNSYDGNGSTIKSYVHYSSNYVNAFWNGLFMTYGDGDNFVDPLTALDVCGHEIAHGVCSKTADLSYYAEPGALNEALSDIWGATIEHYTAPNKSTWEIGEDMHWVIRSMSDPNTHQQPDTYLGDYWYTDFGDNAGVHTNSGVMNYWYYLLVTGKSGTNDHGFAYNVTGIGFDDAASIVYRMETVYLTSYAEYADARAASIEAAIDIFGASSTQVLQTRRAWDAVGVYDSEMTPSDLFASIIAAHGIGLTWSDHSTVETSFVIERSASASGGFTPIQTVPANTLTYTDSDLAPGIYYYRVKAMVDGYPSSYSNIASTGWMDDEPLLIAEGQATACNTIFMDAGGLDNYDGDDNFVFTVYPAEAGKKLKVSFSSFSLALSSDPSDGRGDFFHIYDGVPFEGLINQYEGNTLPPDANATNPSGALTFRFYSYKEDLPTAAGWQAMLTCVTVPDPPTNLVATATSQTRIDLTWTDNSSGETGFVIEFSPSVNATTVGNAFIRYQELARVPANATDYAHMVSEDEQYTYRVRAITDGVYSAYSNIATGTAGRPALIMANGEFTVCNSPFLDPGGYGAYPVEYMITTLSPAEPGSVLRVRFNDFKLVDVIGDYLGIYDGGSTNARVIGYFSGKTIPKEITATNPEGKLTFEFYPEGFIRYSGWRADVTCVPRPTAPIALSAQANGNSINLAWTDVATDETGYVIERSTGNGFSVFAFLPPNAQSAQEFNVPLNRTYSYRVRADRGGVYSDFSNVATITLGIPHILMQNGNVNACNTAFLDADADQPYGDKEEYVLTISPDAPGTHVIIDFDAFDLETDYDFLWIYDGADTQAPILGSYTGDALPPPAVASNPEGKLTLRFKSDDFVHGAGWQAHISCAILPLAPADLQAQKNVDVIRLDWNDLAADETGYRIERATGNQFITIATVESNIEFYEDHDYPTDRTITYRVRAIRDQAVSLPSNTSSVENGNLPVILMDGTITTCNSTFLDAGGDEHHGLTSSDNPVILTIGPDEPGKNVAVDFNSFDVSDLIGNNYLRIYNGIQINNSSLLGQVSAKHTHFQAANPDGKLTFVFQALNNPIKAGWKASITCVTKGDPLITFKDSIVSYREQKVLLTPEAYAGADFAYTLVNDGSSTGSIELTKEQDKAAVKTLRPGVVKIKATLAETPYFNGAEKTMTLTITKATPEVFFYGQDAKIGVPYELRATAYDGAVFNFEKVEDSPYTSGEADLSGPGNKMVTPLKVGIVDLRATAQGNDFYEPSSYENFLFIEKGNPVITFLDKEISISDTPFDLQASAFEGAEFIYTIQGNNSGEVSLSGIGNRTVTPVREGTVKIKVYLQESSEYVRGEKLMTLTISPRSSQTITFYPLPDMFFSPAPITLSASASSGLPVTFSVTSGPATVSGNVMTLTGEGIVQVTAEQSGDANYIPAEAITRSFTVVPAPIQGVEDEYPGESITLWPNPAREIVNIQSTGSRITSLSLIDLLGRAIRQEYPGKPEHSFDLKTVDNGMYLLHIKTDSEGSVVKRLQVLK